MRQSCLKCVAKHLSQAIILIHESEMGHPEHKYLAIGHLAEASDEALGQYAALARDIRSIRKIYEKTGEGRGLWGTFLRVIYMIEKNQDAPPKKPEDHEEGLPL